MQQRRGSLGSLGKDSKIHWCPGPASCYGWCTWSSRHGTSSAGARWPGSPTIDATTPHPPSDFEDTPTSSQVHGTHDTPKEQKEKEKKEEDDEKKERGGR
ncbi:hypothetical protein CPAR01_07535 [Colletotrichum paranaense]|uniref:Uncharacterized protein n=1 Tax=Colletotrichum paranaense TaxID=1914294 RepID=A0ABQ9SPU8_9PEZI|nr:uncharacterized protein CPAR01_07535 [Colletotrichum paranaense]KAK1541546.1 hypothetical protein CPAR01_07535 [Colletotrichum paranaense]